MNYIFTTIIWFLIGANLLNLIVLIFSRTGILYSKYNEKGGLKEKVPPSGVIASISLLLLLILLFILFDYFTFRNNPSLNFPLILLMNFILLILLELYDAFFIDIFVIGIWRPAILKLKDYYSLDSMKTHVKEQFTKAWILKIPLIVIGSSVYYLLDKYLI